MTLVIGIAGRMRTGKTSLAQLLSEYLLQTHKTTTISFAEAVRVEVAKAIWPSKDKSEGRYMLSLREQEHKESVRPLLQALGQAKRQMVDEDYWVKKVETEIRCKWTAHDIAIIDDVRHHNEADFCIKNGILIRLHAPERVLIERGANPERLIHYSENAMQGQSPQELRKPHRVLTLNTAGLSPKGMLKALRPFIDELIEGDFE